MADYRRQRSELAAALKEWANASEAYVAAFLRFRSATAKVADAADAIGSEAWRQASYRALEAIGRFTEDHASPAALEAINETAAFARRGRMELPLTAEAMTRESWNIVVEAERLGVKLLR